MRLRLVAVLTALALVLVACGGDDGDGDNDQDQIRDLVETFYGNNEGVCDAVTDKLLKDQFESKKQCEKAASAADPQEDYEITKITVTGDDAKVQVKVEDQTGTLLTKKEDGEWKVDGIEQ